MIILGIDPGISGALAFYLHDPIGKSGLMEVYDMPILDGDINPLMVRHLLGVYKPNAALIEQASPHPKEGVKSVWRYAAAFATVCAVVALDEIPIARVSPAKWKKAMSVNGSKEGKEQSRRLAVELCPNLHERFARVKDHGRAEAALIAIYASRLTQIRNHDAV